MTMPRIASPVDPPRLFNKVLVANRGEIAVRVISTLQRLGITSVAVYSEADIDALHVALADESVCIGPVAVQESYMDIQSVINAAIETNAEAIHPGYGFLAENSAFADAVSEAGLIFIGPEPQTIEAMGSKINSRKIMLEAGIQTVPGAYESVDTVEQAIREAETIGYPIAVKASGAGGGKGFRVAYSAAEMPEAYTGAQNEGERFFSDPTVYLERYLHDPRHVEVQILADRLGNVVHLYDRDCSIQRRHQKLVEEAPAPTVSSQLRQLICDQAVRAARAVDYVGAGTIEGLVAKNVNGEDEFFFLEMNTRIQVEHGISELITGVDIVEQQLRAAAGEALSINQEDIRIQGHAIEVRVNAENAAKGFLPCAGVISEYLEPQVPGIRIDTGIGKGSIISPHYDSLMCKVLVCAPTREEATEKMIEALEDFVIEGPKATLLPFYQALLRSEEWNNAETCRNIIADPQAFLALAESDGKVRVPEG